MWLLGLLQKSKNKAQKNKKWTWILGLVWVMRSIRETRGWVPLKVPSVTFQMVSMLHWIRQYMDIKKKLRLKSINLPLSRLRPDVSRMWGRDEKQKWIKHKVSSLHHCCKQPTHSPTGFLFTACWLSPKNKSVFLANSSGTCIYICMCVCLCVNY